MKRKRSKQLAGLCLLLAAALSLCACDKSTTESGAFFARDKTAEETAKVIQNRGSSIWIRT